MTIALTNRLEKRLNMPLGIIKSHNLPLGNYKRRVPYSLELSRLHMQLAYDQAFLKPLSLSLLRGSSLEGFGGVVGWRGSHKAQQHLQNIVLMCGRVAIRIQLRRILGAPTAADR
jgi:hypothetical protein